MTPRLGVITIIVIGCSAHAVAQTPGDPSAFIEWSADRLLTVKDFKGKVPARAGDTSLSWVAIDSSWECDAGKASWRARAVFDPNRSFWREMNRNIWQEPNDRPPMAWPTDDGGRGLLAHEQLHFDLTEIWARKIRAVLETLPAACKTPGASHGVETAIAAIEREWLAEQQRYDKETGHGLDAARQKAWAAKTANALKERYTTPAAPAAADR
jgi:hypothetical protein